MLNNVELISAMKFMMLWMIYTSTSTFYMYVHVCIYSIDCILLYIICRQWFLGGSSEDFGERRKRDRPEDVGAWGRVRVSRRKC